MSALKRDHLDDLLSDRALQGLSAEEAAELATLLEGAEDDSFDLAAAAVAVASSHRHEALPAHLAASVEARALAVIPAAAHPTSFLRVRAQAGAGRDPWRFAGWVAAAACLALAATAWLTRPSRSTVAVTPPAPTPRIELPVKPVAPTPADLRSEVLAARDAVHVDWKATKDPAARGATGDVVWSNAQQRGYMRFHGLAANDASKTQYQLWIFDPSQSEKTPVDGGVFDVDPSTGDVIVAIAPKLHVSGPTLFAVTVEKPGGVVVSKRERIVLIAPAKG